MYIRSLSIKNLKRLHDLTLPFTHADGSPRMWTVLIGENGTGKTSILQAIALAAAGQLRVNDLVGNSFVHLVDRRQSEALEISASFAFTQSNLQQGKALHPLHSGPVPSDLHLQSQVRLEREETSLRAHAWYGDKPRTHQAPSQDPLDNARSKELPRWFVIGFGVRRNLPLVGRIPDLTRPSVDRMKSLFDSEHALTSTSFLSHFVESKARAYSAALKSAIIDTDVLPTDLADLELRGQGGVAKASDLIERERFQQTLGTTNVKVPAVALAHGYQSTIAWIADLVGHILLESDESGVAPRDFEGLVLIDEIDLYLHPKWQAQLIPALRRTFPKLQFVATTHSPVVLGALVPEEVVRLEADPQTGHVQRITPDAETGEWDPVDKPEDLDTQPDPRMMTATEMYRDYFGLDRLTLNPFGEQLRAYTALATHPHRNDHQQHEMERLRKELKNASIESLESPLPRPRARKVASKVTGKPKAADTPKKSTRSANSKSGT